jgi:hypothetical protein
MDSLRVWRERIVKRPDLNQQRADTAGVWGTAKWLYEIRPDGSLVDPITAAETSGGGFQEHELNVLGLAALTDIECGEIVEASAWLTAGLELEVKHTSLVQRYAWIRAKTGDLSQYANYQAAIEALG